MIKAFNYNNLRRVLAGFLILTLCAVFFGCSSIQIYIAEGEKDCSEQVNSETDLYSDITITAEEYYTLNGTLIKSIDVGVSSEVHTEKETFLNLTTRGFTQYPITTETSISGELIDEFEISDQAQTKHPMYITYYITGTGDLWTIMEINGHVFANPVSYNLTENGAGQVILSETNSIFSYDPISNAFYETIPNISALKVVTVNYIDADTLEKMTAEEIRHNA